MGYVKIKVLEEGTAEELQRWKEQMLEEPKCWNKFCFGLYGEYELRAVYVEKEGDEDNIYLTILCEDCIKTTANYGVLVNDKHLVSGRRKK